MTSFLILIGILIFIGWAIWKICCMTLYEKPEPKAKQYTLPEQPNPQPLKETIRTGAVLYAGYQLLKDNNKQHQPTAPQYNPYDFDELEREDADDYYDRMQEEYDNMEMWDTIESMGDEDEY